MAAGAIVGSFSDAGTSFEGGLILRGNLVHLVQLRIMRNPQHGLMIPGGKPDMTCFGQPFE